MSAYIKLPLKPFTVPNFVVVNAPTTTDQSSHPLEMVDPETLERMCDAFRDAVFKKANKKRPKA